MQIEMTSMYFFRTTCLKLVVVFAVLLPPAICFSTKFLDTPVPETVRKQTIKMYDEASECMKLCSPAYASAPRPEQGLSIRFVLEDDQPKEIEAYRSGDMMLRVRANSMRWTSIVNAFLRNKYKPPTGWQPKPALTREAAIERAKEYLKIFKVYVPPNYRLEEVKFSTGPEGRSDWLVVWSRVSGQYLWDTADSLNTETVFVAFCEKEGLEVLSAQGCNCPEPKRLEVKISKEDAIAKATRCIPLLQQSEIYRSCREGGFVVKSVKSCELRVVAPNWWLDPKRAVLFREGQVTPETRLCWRITFETMDSKQEERRRKGELGPKESLVAPEMTLCIDAATGEAVGANST